jgi:hypothetical protein
MKFTPLLLTALIVRLVEAAPTRAGLELRSPIIPLSRCPRGINYHARKGIDPDMKAYDTGPGTH